MGNKSAPPPPPPPPPPPAPSLRHPRAIKPVQPASSSNVPPRGSFGLGVEVEFLLSSRKPDGSKKIRDFSQSVANFYNKFLEKNEPGRHPEMHNAIDEAFHGPKFSEWTLDSDSTIRVPSGKEVQWGLECISPIFRAHQGSTWREHIVFLWDFLQAYYHVDANSSCGTHVHLSRAGGYELDDLKKICSSIIHFEPAFEALLPKDRRSNIYARSNWIDNRNFAGKNLSRWESIAEIQRVATIRDLVLLMNPDRDKMFGWNFLYLLNNANGTIEFRRGASCKSAQEVFVWIEIAMSFVEAAVQHGTPQELAEMTNNVGGLKKFIRKTKFEKGPGLYEQSFLDLFFGEVDKMAFREPRPLGTLSDSELKRLKKKKDDDEKKNIAAAKMMPESYWI
ncbi:putative amidoligase enzyme domain-containing protein [Trichoderma austrokoningii]